MTSTILDQARLTQQSYLDSNFSKYLDNNDELKEIRNLFFIPTKNDINGCKDDTPCIYLCGNSLGLQPRSIPGLIQSEVEKWQKKGVRGHFVGERPWKNIDTILTDKMAKVVGALPIEVAVMGTLSHDIHTLMVPFYRPTPQRYKIIIEAGPFPSDMHIINSQVLYHGFDPKDAVIRIAPRKGEYSLRTEDIIDVINKTGSKLALLFLPGIQFETGQFFEIPELTRAAHNVGAIAGWDLAHAVGNVILKLHDWNVDFAAWCSYKYLNAGPGGIAGIFVHEKYAHDKSLRKLAGWWGQDESTRFKFDEDLTVIPGASGLRLSNPSVLNCMCLLGSLDIFDQVGMDAFCKKQAKLTGYLELLLQDLKDQVIIITPEKRGCQLSLLFKNLNNMKALEEDLHQLGIVIDVRKNIIRVAPSPLYNTYTDVYDFVNLLQKLLKLLVQKMAKI